MKKAIYKTVFLSLFFVGAVEFSYAQKTTTTNTTQDELDAQKESCVTNGNCTELTHKDVDCSVKAEDCGASFTKTTVVYPCKNYWQLTIVTYKKVHVVDGCCVTEYTDFIIYTPCGRQSRTEAEDKVINQKWDGDDQDVQTELFQNYPNPSNQSTTIAFSLNDASDLNFKIVDITGKVVFEKQVVGNKGINQVEVSTADFSTGIYTYMLNVNGNMLSNRMIVNR